MGLQRPVVVSQRWPAAQAVPGQDGTQNEQQPVEHHPSVQSASEPHSDAQPAPPQIDPTVQDPHSEGQSLSTRQAAIEPGS